MRHTWQFFMAIFFLGMFFAFAAALPARAEPAAEAALLEQQINEKIEAIRALAAQVAAARGEASQAASRLEEAQREQQDRQAAYEKAKDTYERAAKNPDITTPETLLRLTREYQEASRALQQADADLKAAARAKAAADSKLARLLGEKEAAESGLKALKGDLFDLKLKEPVWAEGYGEAVQSEDKTPLQCRELALAIARRDAMERGGKFLIASVTRVMLGEVKEDTIDVSGKVQVIGQDTSGDMGVVKQVVEGGVVKYVVRVRLQVVAVGVKNPYRDDISSIPGAPAAPPPGGAATIGQPAGDGSQPGDSGPVRPAVPEGMVLVEGGTFAMGSDSGYGDEKPVHRVTVRSFLIAKHEVTFEEYDKFCADTGRDRPPSGGWSRVGRPVVNVSWYDAVEYCNWRSQREGLTPAYSGSGNEIRCDFNANGYRLPTEAEWEYAARGGRESSGYLYSGGNDPDAVAWYNDNSGGSIHLVGTKLPNELGIYDMSGNVWEWCWDWSGLYSDADQKNPTGPSTGNERIARGGSWFNPAELIRPTCRVSYSPDGSDSDLGFRVVRTY